MNRLYIIILDPMVDTSIVRSRILDMDNFYVIYENQYLLISEHNSAKDLYDVLTRNIPQTSGIVVLGVSRTDLTYWGYSSKGLWSWLKENVSETF